MVKLIGRRLLQMLLIMVTVSIILFLIFDSDTYKKRIALAELGNFGLSSMSEADYQAWLEEKGLNIPVFQRYGQWVGGIFTGDLGQSFEKARPVAPLLGERLLNTGILAFWVFALMIPSWIRLLRRIA